MRKSIKKFAALVIAVILAVGVMPLTTWAAMTPVNIWYYDVEDDSNRFPNNAWTEQEIKITFETPDGSYTVNNDEQNVMFNGAYGVIIGGNGLAGITQTGRYSISSFPIPEGYEVVGVFYERIHRISMEDYSSTSTFERDGFTVTQRDLDIVSKWGAEMNDGLIGWLRVVVYVRKIDSASIDPVTFAVPTASTVLVNGEGVAFDAYNINGNNYFKLRDLAYTLNGTAKQFEVDWDEVADAISLASGQLYTSVGGEMPEDGYCDVAIPIPTNSKILLNGSEISLTAYNIDGNNYFKLRDIGAAFDFGVDWDGENNAIVIDTSKAYTTE